MTDITRGRQLFNFTLWKYQMYGQNIGEANCIVDHRSKFLGEPP